MSVCILITLELRMICIFLELVLDVDLNVWNIKFLNYGMDYLRKDLKEQTSLNIFKNRLKSYLITKLYSDNNSRLLFCCVIWHSDCSALVAWCLHCTFWLAIFVSVFVFVSYFHLLHKSYVNNYRQSALMIIWFSGCLFMLLPWTIHVFFK